MRQLIIYLGMVFTMVYICGLIPAHLPSGELPEGTYSVCERLGENVVAAAGWPIPFMYDGNMTSPVCSTGWSQILFFEDVLRIRELGFTVLLCAVVAALVCLGFRFIVKAIRADG